MKRALFAGAIALLFLSSEAQALGRNSDANLKIATAAHLKNMLSDDVTVSDVKRKMLSVRWTAETPAGTYRCEADDMVRNVNCVKTEPKAEASA